MKLNEWAGSVIAIMIILFTMIGAAGSVDIQPEVPTYPLPPAPSDLVAFPGAEGWGASALTTCNRDTVFVYKVTSNAIGNRLNGTLDSLLFALSGPVHPDTLKVITFDVGGWHYVLETDLILDCLYVAMQTAPGGGVGFYQLAGDNIELDGATSEDMVFRGGTFTGRAESGATQSIVDIVDARRVILDQMTFAWPKEKHVRVGASGAGDTVEDVTISHVLFAESANEPTGVQITEQDVAEITQRVSLAYDLWHSNSYRNPMCTVEGDRAKYDTTPRCRLVGNAWYNTRQANVEVRGRMADIVDGYLKSGPYSLDGVPTGSDYSWIVAQNTDNDARPDSATSVHVDQIVGVHNQDTTIHIDSLWADGGAHQEVARYYNEVAGGGGDPRDILDAGIKRDTPIPALPDFPITRISPHSLPDLLFGTASDSGQVGDYRRIQCDGTWAFRADSLLSALLKHARDSTGISTTPDSTYIAARQLYTKPAGTACTDSDLDGMPDAYEDRMSDLDKNTANDRSTDSDGDGWTAMEEYVNGTSSDTYTASDGTEGGAGVCQTYSGGRCVFIFPLVGVLNDDTLMQVGDSVYNIKYGTADLDSVPLLTQARQWIKAGHDSAVVLTCEVLSEADADSTDVETLWSAWGFSGQPPWEVDPPVGCP